MEPQVDIDNLARLARLELSEGERAELAREIPTILAFVAAIDRAPQGGATAAAGNVMRDDAALHDGGAYSEVLLAAAPARVDDRIAVKQVVSRKRAKQ